MLTLNEEAIEHVANDAESTRQGLLVILGAAAATLTSYDMFGLIERVANLVFVGALGFILYYSVAKPLILDGPTGEQYFRYLSNSCIVFWLAFIPVVGIPLQILASSWFMIANIVILSKMHHMPFPRAFVLGGIIPFLMLAASVSVNTLGLLF